MASLLEIRDHIKRVFSRFDIYIMPVIKFLLMYITLVLINGKLGYMNRLNNGTMTLLVSLVSAIMPMNFLLLASAAFIILHLYAFSMECAVVVLVLFVLMFLLYFRFASGDGLLVMLTPVCCMLNIPMVIPVSAGLLCSPASAVSVCCGMLIHSIMEHIVDNETTLSTLDAESTVQKYRLVVDGIINNKSLLVILAAFGMTVIIVYIIRRLPIDYCWMIAIVTGLITPFFIILIGGLAVDTDIKILPWIPGAIGAFFILLIIHFFGFTVDYQRTERVQFEDDEYYYYVRAVPKMTVARADKTVKKITPHRNDSYSLGKSKGRERSTVMEKDDRLREPPSRSSKGGDYPFSSKRVQQNRDYKR